jgi:acyl-CoA synthetase (NDP forming)
MTSSARQANLGRLLSPRHIAFIGGRDAEVAIGEARRIGFAGSFWPVNPRRETLGGLRCHAHVDDLPEAPDAVFLAVPAEAAVDTVATLAARGAGGIVCYTAGFREAGAAGAALEARLVAAAGEMALVGPNCYGVINYLDRAALWPFAHGGTCPGWGAAIVTQSGMLSSDITMTQRSLPLTHMISCGNQSVLSLEDYVEHLIGNPAVRAIGLHIEGLRDVPRFARIAAQALASGVPIVALKTGSSQIGASLTVSHTGSLSGTDDLYDALFARTGVIRVRSPAQLVETLKFLCVAGVPAGNRVAGFTCSGGGATMLADHAEAIGLGFPPFEGEGRERLAALLPPIATVSNPLDYTTPIWGNPARTGPVFETAMALAEADAAVLVQDYPAPGLDESHGYYFADAEAFCAAARARGIPAAICATFSENLDAATRAALVEQGVAPMQGLTETLDAMRAAILWAQARRAPAPLLPQPLLPLQGAIATLDEGEAKALLGRAGVQIPRGRICDGAGLAAAAVAVGFPVALKMLGPRLAHKSEAGAVAIGIADEAALGQAAERMRRAVAAYDPAALTDRFLVEAMAPAPVAELLVGLRRDPEFGVVLTLGAGGVLVELLEDVQTILLPARPEEIRAALRRLRIGRLLAGYRGKPGANIDAIVETIEALARLIGDPAGRIVEIEINPLFAGVDGAVAVDALIRAVADDAAAVRP